MVLIKLKLKKICTLIIWSQILSPSSILLTVLLNIPISQNESGGASSSESREFPTSPSLILRRVAMNDLRRSPGRPSTEVRYLIVTPLAAWDSTFWATDLRTGCFRIASLRTGKEPTTKCLSPGSIAWYACACCASSDAHAISDMGWLRPNTTREIHQLPKGVG